jgi:hypothetical protein
MNDFIITIQDFVVPASSDPNRCRLYGFLVDTTGAPLRNFPLEIKNRSRPHVVTDSEVERAVGGYSVTYLTNQDGYVEFDLIRNGTYDVFFPSESPNPFKTNTQPYFEIMIPDLASMSLIDLLYPVPESLEFVVVSPIVLAIGADLDLDVVLINTDTKTAKNLNEVEILSSDEAIVVVSIVGNKTIHLHRTAAGSVFITAQIRQDKVVVKKQPEPTLILIVNSVEDPLGIEVI